MNKDRCSWCVGNALYEKYHDEEWGVPVHDETKHFEFLLLESQQAGLSWLTILKKRENYRKAFMDFDPTLISKFTVEQIEELIQNPGIIRNKLKILAIINNAKCFLKVQEEFELFDNYIWSFTNNKIIYNNWSSLKEIPTTSPLAENISLDLKKRGFKFLGATTIYAHLQAIGIINDHLTSCFRSVKI